MAMVEADSLFILLGVAAFMAGLIDAVVGGGGLVQIPALFTALPSALPASLLGTNKLASVIGTASAAVQYARRIPIRWGVALPAAAAALPGAWLGARTAVYLPADLVRPIVLALLVVVAVYTFAKRDFGVRPSALPLPSHVGLIAGLGGLGLGFYDGFFGPGTGSFLIFLFVRVVGLDFLHASATAKIVNVATNLAALAYFSVSVEVLWQLGVLMAACNLCGALLGSRLALVHDAGFVRKVFLVVVVVLIARMTFDLV